MQAPMPTPLPVSSPFPDTAPHPGGSVVGVLPQPPVFPAERGQGNHWGADGGAAKVRSAQLHYWGLTLPHLPLGLTMAMAQPYPVFDPSPSPHKPLTLPHV